ncbi:MAG: RNA polymerase sigma factor [Chloroflexota bacterium]|nr:RNA polymerase sigma factor [Chloroflexota bacterium]
MLKEIVERACAKDRLAFGSLYELYKEPLGKRLAYLIGDKDVAYELYQEMFIHFWKRLPIPPPLNFEAWLYRIARNAAFDYLRHVKRLEFLPLLEQEDAGSSGYPNGETLSETGFEERVCELICIQQALMKMSPQYRICVLLQDLWGYSQQEIAASLGIRESAVSANISRGHKQLRAAYWKMMHEQPALRKGEQSQ